MKCRGGDKKVVGVSKSGKIVGGSRHKGYLFGKMVGAYERGRGSKFGKMVGVIKSGRSVNIWEMVGRVIGSDRGSYKVVGVKTGSDAAPASPVLCAGEFLQISYVF